jgi:hypothetical protein
VFLVVKKREQSKTTIFNLKTTQPKLSLANHPKNPRAPGVPCGQKERAKRNDIFNVKTTQPKLSLTNHQKNPCVPGVPCGQKERAERNDHFQLENHSTGIVLN